MTSGKSDEGVFGVSVSISAVPLSTIFGSRQFRRRPFSTSHTAEIDETHVREEKTLLVDGNFLCSC